MKHLGDITKIHGDQIEPVDCITFGSPCQDLSIAGRRAGLAGERSGLFMEAVRIIKEMRSSTNGLHPTFAIWENVPGAFSSNGGEDFRAVLEELARIAQPDVSIPRPSGRRGRWSKAGAIAGNEWSLAWRQLDAQYWGVPQRRKRIALVADFGGQRAAEILFERTSLSWNLDESIQAWEEAAGLATSCPSGNDRMVEHVTPINTQIATRYKALGERTGLGIGQENDPAYTLQAGHEHGVCYCIAGNVIDRSKTAGANGVGATENVSYTLNTVDRPAVAYTLKIRSGCEGCGKGALVQTEKSATLSTLQDQTLFQPIVFDNHAQDARYSELKSVCPTVTARWGTGGGNTPIVARQTFNEQSFNHYKESDKCSTLKAKAGNIGNGSECLVAEKTSVAVDGYNGAVTGDKTASLTCKNDGSHSGPLVAEKIIRWIVRRLTPVECERLQGYPDGWTDIGDWTDSKGKKHKYADSPRYKALGNSIALPQWFWLVQKMRPYLKEKPKLGSLFDGIGGFPLVWQRAYGEGTARWASEIEEFPMAVTKRRFGEE